MDSFTVPDLFATVIALSALVLSGWQFLVSRRDKNPKLAVAASAEMQGPPFRQNADQNPAFFAFVEVTNVGEVPVRIKSVELRFDQGRHTKEGAGLPSMSGV